MLSNIRRFFSVSRHRKSRRRCLFDHCPAIAAQVENFENRVVCSAGPTAALPSFGAQEWNAPTAFRGFMVTPATFADPTNRAQAIAELKSWNVNLVRWEMNPTADRPILDQAREFADQIAAITGDFRGAGISIILDLHPANDGGAINKTLARSVTARDSFIAAWKHLATQFRTDTAVVGYDILNEPNLTNST
jgi:hypothetical protein